jgi:hypothetical protein
VRLVRCRRLSLPAPPPPPRPRRLPQRLPRRLGQQHLPFTCLPVLGLPPAHLTRATEAYDAAETLVLVTLTRLHHAIGPLAP